jgi:hypothetical protein
VTHALQTDSALVEVLEFPYDKIDQGFSGVAIVRDPVERFISSLSMYYGNKDNWIWSESITQEHRNVLDVMIPESYCDMVDLLARHHPDVYDNHLHPQADLIGDFPVEIIMMEDIEPWFKNRFNRKLNKDFASDANMREKISSMVYADENLLNKLREFYAADYKLRDKVESTWT